MKYTSVNMLWFWTLCHVAELPKPTITPPKNWGRGELYYIVPSPQQKNPAMYETWWGFSNNHMQTTFESLHRRFKIVHNFITSLNCTDCRPMERPSTTAPLGGPSMTLQTRWRGTLHRRFAQYFCTVHIRTVGLERFTIVRFCGCSSTSMVDYGVWILYNQTFSRAHTVY